MTSNRYASLESGPRPAAPSHGPEAEALLDEVRAAIATLTKLLSHGPELGEPVMLAIRSALDEVSQKVDRRELRVAVVGEEHSGKSTFLDALLGERLLGLAKTPPNTVTTIRCREEMGYRARLSDGFIDDFALRAPDRTAQLLAEIENADAKAGDAKKRSVAAAIEVAAAADAVERVQTAMAETFRAFETAREDAERWSAKLEAAQQARGRLSNDAADLEKRLPVLFQPPPWWALWLWVIRFTALLLNWRTRQNHRALLLACGKAEAELQQLRVEASRAAERCSQAEAKLSTVNIPVEEARLALETARRAQHDAEAECTAWERAVLERRLEIERERSERRRRFAADVRALTNTEDRGKDVLDLEIDYPARLLPDDIVLIETPGVTSDDARAGDRAWRAIRERADACVLVSELERAVSGESQRFLQRLRELVPHAILLLTKMDETLTEATRKRDAEPDEMVERARRVGTRRFAREVGRDPSTVLSVTVAAEEALRDGPSSEPARRRFETDVATLFTLLRYERALILGASSASIVRRCIGGLGDADVRAARLHRDRIAALEAKRIPNPDQFYEEQMAAAGGAIDESAKSVLASAALVLREAVELARVECKTKIASCQTKGELEKLAPELAAIIDKGVISVRERIAAHVQTHADRGVEELERGAFRALRERYYILHQITRPADLRVFVNAPLAQPAVPVDFASKLADSIRSFDRLRLGFGVGGAALGASVGTLFLPGIGSLAGALVGGLSTFAKSFGALKRDFDEVVRECWAGLERPLSEEIAAAHPFVAAAMRTSLGKSLEQALARFAPFIDEPIEEARAALASEREKLHDLEALHRRLQDHDARLESLIKTATEASVGLCR